MTHTTTDRGPAMNAACLEDLLNRQIDRLRRYDLDAAMACAEQAEPIAAELMRSGFLDRPENAELKSRIQSLYRELMLVIASERQEVSDKLAQIRNGIKAFERYAEK
ncbi:MAG TPA: hypothetical protein ENN97_02430 [Phycisphaerales bacterium]|nr:hypothetical protein [Phycisphaerales bacterium]